MNLWKFSSLGLEFGIIILAGVYLGNFLDKYFDTEPYLLFILLFVAFAVGLYHIIYKTKEL